MVPPADVVLRLTCVEEEEVKSADPKHLWGFMKGRD